MEEEHHLTGQPEELQYIATEESGDGEHQPRIETVERYYVLEDTGEHQHLTGESGEYRYVTDESGNQQLITEIHHPIEESVDNSPPSE